MSALRCSLAFEGGFDGRLAFSWSELDAGDARYYPRFDYFFVVVTPVGRRLHRKLRIIRLNRRAFSLLASFHFAGLPSARSEPRDGRLSFVLCQGDVTANKWIVVSAEERSLFRGRSSRPSKGRQVSFAPRWSMVVVRALKGSFPLRLQPSI